MAKCHMELNEEDRVKASVHFRVMILCYFISLSFSMYSNNYDWAYWLADSFPKDAVEIASFLLTPHLQTGGTDVFQQGWF